MGKPQWRTHYLVGAGVHLIVKVKPLWVVLQSGNYHGSIDDRKFTSNIAGGFGFVNIKCSTIDVEAFWNLVN